jgi:hypothetical protein
MWRRVALVRTDVSEEHIASIIRMQSIRELGTTLAVNAIVAKKYRMLSLFLARWLFPTWWWRWYVPLKRRFIQEPHGITSQQILQFTGYFLAGRPEILVYISVIFLSFCMKTLECLLKESENHISYVLPISVSTVSTHWTNYYVCTWENVIKRFQKLLTKWKESPSS